MEKTPAMSKKDIRYTLFSERNRSPPLKKGDGCLTHQASENDLLLHLGTCEPWHLAGDLTSGKYLLEPVVKIVLKCKATGRANNPAFWVLTSTRVCFLRVHV